MTRSVTRMMTCYAVIAAAVTTHVASGAPITLKFASVSSDRSTMYLSAIKPFVDAVDRDAKGLIDIKVYFSGALGRDPRQENLILDGRADFAFVTPGFSRNQFPDVAALELPGLFKNIREASLVHSRLAARHLLRGYENYVVIATFASAPESIHTRSPVSSLASLKGETIRVNNEYEGAGLEKLGMKTASMPIYKVAEAISQGKIDGTAAAAPVLVDFGIGRVAANHYMLATASAPLAILMSRKTFDRLPKEAQDIVRKYSDGWITHRFIRDRQAEADKIMKRYESDPRRKVIFPSSSDLEKAHAAFKAVRDDYAKVSPRHVELLRAVETELSKVRASN